MLKNSVRSGDYGSSGHTFAGCNVDEAIAIEDDISPNTRSHVPGLPAGQQGPGRKPKWISDCMDDLPRRNMQIGSTHFETDPVRNDFQGFQVRERQNAHVDIW